MFIIRKHTKHIYPKLSMSWLKRNFARLGLKRRRADPPMEDLETITKVDRSRPTVKGWLESVNKHNNSYYNYYSTF